MPIRKYSPELVNRFVKRVPIKMNKFASLGENGYYTAVSTEHPKPKHVVVLHKIKPETIDKFENLSNIEVHDFSVKDNGTSKEHIRQYARAARALHNAVKKGEPAVVSCEMSLGRTGNVMYLLHRMMGATHSQATKHAQNIRGRNAEVLKEEFEAGFPAFNKKHKGKHKK